MVLRKYIIEANYTKTWKIKLFYLIKEHNINDLVWGAKMYIFSYLAFV